MGIFDSISHAAHIYSARYDERSPLWPPLPPRPRFQVEASLSSAPHAKPPDPLWTAPSLPYIPRSLRRHKSSKGDSEKSQTETDRPISLHTDKGR